MALIVEVVYPPDISTVTLEAGATVRDAVEASGVLRRHPEAREFAVGIFGRRVAFETAVSPGDRVEIYRPLAMDPKEARRRRAASKKKKTSV